MGDLKGGCSLQVVALSRLLLKAGSIVLTPSLIHCDIFFSDQNLLMYQHKYDKGVLYYPKNDKIGYLNFGSFFK